MEKRLVLALFLSLIVVYLYSTFFAPAPPPKPKLPLPQTKQPHSEQKSDQAGEEFIAPSEPGQEEVEQEYVMDTEHYRAVFSNRGAVLKELRLKNYFSQPGLTAQEQQDPQNWVELIGAPGENYAALQLEDLFKKSGADLSSAVWQAQELVQENGLEFQLTTAKGVSFFKKIVFPPDAYHALITLTVRNENQNLIGEDWDINFLPSAGIARDDYDVGYYPHPIAVTGYSSGSQDYYVEIFTAPRQQDDPGDRYNFPLPGSNGAIAFAGDTNKYFAAFCEPLANTKIAYTKADVLFDFKEYTKRKQRTSVSTPDQVLRQGLFRLCAVRCGLSFHMPSPGQEETKEFLLYLGPKDPAIIRSAEEYPAYYPFSAIISKDLGFFGSFGKVLLWILDQFYALVQNYGFAIILLTLLVRGVLFPLSRRQQIAMQETQKKAAKLKPLLEEVQKKYKNNRQKLAEEQMKIYRKHGFPTPPLGGCLIMFLQIPIFFGLYSSLGVAWELRHAPFFWVKDLARPDQLFVFSKPIDLWFIHLSGVNLLPIAMVIFYFIQMSSMPKPPDPQQAQMQSMMKWMFLLFFFMLYNSPAGLCLYMVTTFAWSIFEQKVIRKNYPAAQPVAK